MRIKAQLEKFPLFLQIWGVNSALEPEASTAGPVLLQDPAIRAVVSVLGQHWAEQVEDQQVLHVGGAGQHCLPYLTQYRVQVHPYLTILYLMYLHLYTYIIVLV